MKIKAFLLSVIITCCYGAVFPAVRLSISALMKIWIALIRLRKKIETGEDRVVLFPQQRPVLFSHINSCIGIASSIFCL